MTPYLPNKPNPVYQGILSAYLMPALKSDGPLPANAAAGQSLQNELRIARSRRPQWDNLADEDKPFSRAAVISSPAMCCSSPITPSPPGWLRRRVR